ncbi:unnamed protein product [Ambrosiozyma monospora]|uniref:Unnamed protein product n=1 Tax=Ambrosiozyma monospora TaxID=43982 RepID=A0ACB5TEW2_AMBMO|nr:unnamed protein product [Ambrosiozyma monospora]
MKNVAAIFVLLEVGVDEQNHLSQSWKDVLIALSQIERLMLLAQGHDSGVVPDLLNARLANRNSIESARSPQSTSFFGFGKKQTISEQAFQHHVNQKLPFEIVSQINFTEMEVAIDRVFSKSCDIEGDGIFDLVAALSGVARVEIESSGQSAQPRMFSLQKLVDVCYANMGRIRVQWSALWAVMNEKFNEFGCHSNPAISFFAINSLRQLSEGFFNIEELSHFKFQDNFLKPFNFIIANNPNLQVKELVLDSTKAMIQKKSDLIKSGWTTLIQVLTTAASENSELIVAKGFDITKMIGRDHFDNIFKQEGYEPLVICLTEYAKNVKFQKISLQALQSMKKIQKTVTLRTAEDLDEATLTQLWFPLLFGYHDVAMEGDDLEVRSKALNYMFDALVENGAHFKGELWDKTCKELLFPMFELLET